LVKEVIAVKTASGRIQLIFKDSFNKENHVKLNKGDTLTEDEAKSFSNDPKFEQTRASKLLLGEVKKQEDKEEKAPKTAEKTGDKPKAKEGEQETTEAQPQKAKRLSKQEILQAMQGMDTNQMASMPLDLQQEYFKSIRAPKKSAEFDNITFEALTNQFGINTTSNLPYNQQVINALIFAAKLKAGANNPMFGKGCTEERAANISAAKKAQQLTAHNKNIPMTEVQKQKIRETKEKNKVMLTCEVCGKTMRQSNFKQYGHGAQCQSKPPGAFLLG
jgi:ssDNA-binding Zn-finger/Zn-ribbon topoisomerase 1